MRARAKQRVEVRPRSTVLPPPLRRHRRLLPAAVALALAACAPSMRAPSPAVDTAAVEECRDFAEQTVPHEPVRGNGGGRSTVYPSKNAESLSTLFDLCMKAKEALK